MIASCKTVNRFKSGRRLQQSPVAFRDRALFTAERFSPGRTTIFRTLSFAFCRGGARFRILSFAFCRGWLGFAPCPSLFAGAGSVSHHVLRFLPGTGLVFASCPSFCAGLCRTRAGKWGASGLERSQRRPPLPHAGGKMGSFRAGALPTRTASAARGRENDKKSCFFAKEMLLHFILLYCILYVGS